MICVAMVSKSIMMKQAKYKGELGQLINTDILI